MAGSGDIDDITREHDIYDEYLNGQAVRKIIKEHEPHCDRTSHEDCPEATALRDGIMSRGPEEAEEEEEV